MLTRGTTLQESRLAERVREVYIVDVYECDTNPTCYFVVGERVAIRTNYPSDDDEGDTSSSGTRHEERPSSQTIDQKDSRNSADAVHNPICASGQKRYLLEHVSLNDPEISGTPTVLPFRPSDWNIVGA